MDFPGDAGSGESASGRRPWPHLPHLPSRGRAASDPEAGPSGYRGVGRGHGFPQWLAARLGSKTSGSARRRRRCRCRPAWVYFAGPSPTSSGAGLGHPGSVERSPRCSHGDHGPSRPTSGSPTPSLGAIRASGIQSPGGLPVGGCLGAGSGGRGAIASGLHVGAMARGAGRTGLARTGRPGWRR